ncbi:MAG: DEAD/DEAH box helicase, partial [Oscillospiraceae bacterium]|nr:DEAD/DEAH box helicase [Oscillospiraceae bacterium]
MVELPEKIRPRFYELLPKFIESGSKLKSFQEKCIEHILSDTYKKDVFCISKTGSGKSLCYQLPALLLNDYTVVISPLTALIGDQIRSLADKDISAVGFYHNSNMVRKEQQEALLNGQSDVKLIYTTPETLQSKSSFFEKLQISMLVIDEAHCVTVWGNDFRTAYRCIKS